MTGAKAILGAALGLAAMIAVGVILWAVAGFSLIEAALSTVCLVLALAYAAGGAGRSREQREQADKLLDLGRVASDLSRELLDVTRKFEDLERTMDERTKAHSAQVATEMRMLQTLIKQLAEGAGRQPGGLRPGASPPPRAGAQTQTSRLETMRGMARGMMGGDKTGGASPADTSARDARSVEDKAREQQALEQKAREAEEAARRAAMLETIRRSLEANRVDLYLQPMVTLPQRQTRYYEGLTRLRDATGEIIMPAQYIPLAEPAGMMPTIDNLLLFRCVNVVRKLVERNRSVGVFCNISAHSLLDAEFFPQFIDYMEHNRGLADALIFEFAQEIVEGFGPLENESLAALASLGFRFSMDQISDVDIDFARLADRNFRFVKLDADILLNRMAEAGGQIHAADFNELLRRNGLTLVAEKVEGERTVLNLLDFDITLAQGFLFGAPKLVRGDVVAETAPGLKAG